MQANSRTDEPPRAVVVGGGTMGTGIVAAFLSAGSHVTLVEPDAARLVAAGDRVAGILAEAVRRGKSTESAATAAGQNLTLVTDLSHSAARPRLIVEAVPEQFELKAAVLAQAERLNPVVLASNTSSLSVDALAQGLAEPGRFLGMHFFNPVAAMPLVEVVQSKATSEATLALALDAVTEIGKEPIVVRDAPGFASTRLGLALGLEAIRMVEQGVAEPSAIDRAMELGYRHPIGPLRLTDLVGLDVRLAIAEHLSTVLGERFTPPALLRSMVEEGRLGKKSGHGFYEW